MKKPHLIISCEHGGNELPEPYQALFLGQEEVLASHRGWDLGALAVAKSISTTLIAPLFFTTISRLLIDTNRSPRHKNLFSEFSRALPLNERDAISRLHYQPHRDLITKVIRTIIEQGEQVIHLAIHSFTPHLNDITRKTDIGLLYDSQRVQEQEFCQRWQDALASSRPDLHIHRNAPYRGASDGLATWMRKRRAQSKYLGIEVEINQKLISSSPEQRTISTLLTQTLLSNLQSPPPSPNSDPKNEIVAIVDTNDRVIGQAPRREMRRHQLIHRATYILVTNHQGQIFVQKRSATKDIYPEFYDIAAGGVVLSGETYEESAQRELAEELGISGKLEHLIDNYFADEGNKVWGRVFLCRHEGPFVLQKTEVVSGEFMAPEAIRTATDANFTPDGLAILATLGKTFPSTPSSQGT